MSDNTQDFRPMQARYLELEAEVEKLRARKKRIVQQWSRDCSRLSKLREADVAYAVEQRDRAEKAEAKLAEVEKERDRLAGVLREIADVTHEPDTRLVARAALASLEEKP